MGEASTSKFNLSIVPEHIGLNNPDRGGNSTHNSPWELEKYRYYVLESESPMNSDHDTESIHSIQAKETDFAKDTTDTDTYSSYESDSTREDVEYELATEVEDNEPALNYMSGNSSLDSDNDIITTKVISVALVDEGDLEFADSEESRGGSCTDPELHLFDYWQCVGCRNPNNNPMFRYCEKCYKVRKNFFPPRPKPKNKCKQPLKKESEFNGRNDEPGPVSPILTWPVLSQQRKVESLTRDSGIESGASQELVPDLDFQNIKVPASTMIAALNSSNALGHIISYDTPTTSTINDNFIKINNIKQCNIDFINGNKQSNKEESNTVISRKLSLKRRTLSLPGINNAKKVKIDGDIRESLDSDSDSSDVGSHRSFSQPLPQSQKTVQPLTKMISDPLLTIENIASHNYSNVEKEPTRARDIGSIPKKAVVNSLRERLADEESNMCITCLVEPKTGVFVHRRIAHICCCYKCAVKVWAKAKRCPVCNQKVSNVLKAITL